ncbi:hypothetical protein C2845_PM08G27970 [Panicum miliaceum]|uniref:F-box/LRR-repeat protein 15/At3g58940/PEG3-like LRR domain-containing protein n=1 Tax=Panicum miliaceum TaxID=4540 RepID=A0A3L6QWK2_PANMI|nr:hypothetical protein C2845_PM08G27970 [Panicum miliaceum]
MHQYDKTVLPRCIFTCHSLEELNLKMGKAPYNDYEHEGLVLPDIIRLPSLKKLSLCDVEVWTSSLEQIIARGPGLEDLHLVDCAQYLDLVDSKVLKRLTVDGFLGRDKGLTIAAPCLIHFKSTCDGRSDFTGVFLNAKRLALFGSGIKLNRAREGAETEPISIAGMTVQCPLLETVIIQCSKDDGEIQKMVDALIATGISLEKIHVTFYEDIQKNVAERKRKRQEGKTGRSILREEIEEGTRLG